MKKNYNNHLSHLNFFLRSLTISTILLSFSVLSAQNTIENSNWLGRTSSLKFNSNEPDPGVFIVDDSNYFPGNSLADSNGDLLLYTSRDLYNIFLNFIPTVIRNKSKNVIKNSDLINGNITFIPRPLHPDHYYVIQSGLYSMHLEELNMNAQRGAGELLLLDEDMLQNSVELEHYSSLSSNDRQLIEFPNENEFALFLTQVEIVRFSNGNIDTIRTRLIHFKITSRGISDVIYPSSDWILTPFLYPAPSRFTFSPDLKKVILHSGAQIFIYDFNIENRYANNRQIIKEVTRNSPSSCNEYSQFEFSQDGIFIYESCGNVYKGVGPYRDNKRTISQFDLSATNIFESKVQYFEEPLADFSFNHPYVMARAHNDKIYARNYENSSEKYYAINNPNEKGDASNFEKEGFPHFDTSPRKGPFFFPQIIKSTNRCLGEVTKFEIDLKGRLVEDIQWDFGDNTTGIGVNTTHLYSDPGVYYATATVTFSTAQRKELFKQKVEIFTPAVAYPIDEIYLCETLEDPIEKVNLNELATPSILNGQSRQDYQVRYFFNERDANLIQNRVLQPFNFSNDKKTIYARADHVSKNSCYEIIQFDVVRAQAPEVTEQPSFIFCDTDDDGIININLQQIKESISQSSRDPNLSISFHLTPDDALNDRAPFPDDFTNSNPFSQTLYTRITNAPTSKCVTLDITIDLIIQPVPEATSITALQCDEDGQLDQLTIFNLSNFDNAVSNNATGVEVQYFLNQEDADISRNPIDKENFSNTQPQQTIIARVTNTSTECYITTSVLLDVSVTDASNTTITQCDDDSAVDGFFTFDLNDATAGVVVNAPNDVLVNYYLSINDALLEVNPLSKLYTNTTAYIDTVYARAESSNGNCFGISEVALIVNAPPSLQPDDTFDYCTNNSEPLTLEAGILLGTISDYTYQWSTGETTPSIEIRDGGIFTVLVTNVSGCSNQRQIIVEVSEPAIINSIETSTIDQQGFGSATAQVSGSGEYQYRIDTYASFQESPTFTNLRAGFYTMYVNDSKGCQETSLDFSIIGYMEFFTPNGDGYNDFWQLNGVNDMFESNATIFIFDRYGKLLNQLSPSSQGWDGTFNGEPLPSSDYWFKATLIDGTEFSSHFTLKR